MRAPEFWWSVQPGLVQRAICALLAPLAAIYGRIAVRRMTARGPA